MTKKKAEQQPTVEVSTGSPVVDHQVEQQIREQLEQQPSAADLAAKALDAQRDRREAEQRRQEAKREIEKSIAEAVTVSLAGRIGPNIAKGLVAAQAAAADVDRDSTGKAGDSNRDYKYASSEAVIKAGKAALTVGKLACIATSYRLLGNEKISATYRAAGFFQGDELEVTYLVIHESGETLECIAVVPVVPGPGRPWDKAVATAETYCLHYFLRFLLMLARVEKGAEPDERDDKDVVGAGGEPQRQPQQQRRQQQRKPEPAKTEAKPQTAAEMAVDLGKLQAWLGTERTAKLTTGYTPVDQALKIYRFEANRIRSLGNEQIIRAMRNVHGEDAQQLVDKHLGAGVLRLVVHGDGSVEALEWLTKNPVDRRKVADLIDDCLAPDGGDFTVERVDDGPPEDELSNVDDEALAYNEAVNPDVGDR